MPAKTKTMKLDADVRDVIERSNVRENDHPRTSEAFPWALFLPEQLARALYVKTAKILKAAGGVWNSQAGATLFVDDPRVTLLGATESGEIIDEKATLQAYFSPPAVVDALLDLADVALGHTVLEPSAGHGAIADACRDLGCEVTCVEIEPKHAQVLSDPPRFAAVLEVDFLEVAPLRSLGPVGFDRVVMNPPFTNGQDCEHVLHAMKFLRPGGRLVSVMAASIRFRQTQPYLGLRNEIESSGGQIVDLPEGSFSASGTGVNVVMIQMTKE